MSDFVLGQRYMSQSEPELGLGQLKAIDARSLTLWFELADCERHYAKHDFPLTRALFEKGDSIEAKDGRTLVVSDIMDHQGLLLYMDDQGQLLPESEIKADQLQNNAQSRLLSGQLDHYSWFALRAQAGERYSQWWQSPVQGFTGARVQPLAHQLYIAKEVADRIQPRVMLCDEVGLGKTIEAGLILARRAARRPGESVLILVPKALQVQWFLELRRRFSLYARLVQSPEDLDNEDSRWIVPLEWLEDPELSQQLNKLDIQMLLVDEVQNLNRDTQGFNQLQQLASSQRSVILLSATPALKGLSDLQSQLQLLDPNFFTPDRLSSIEGQQQQLTTLAKAFSEQRASDAELQELASLIDLPVNQLSPEHHNLVLDRLLARYGTGHLLFRNRRKQIGGYPQRILHAYHQVETFSWLQQFLQQHPKQKALVISQDVDFLLSLKDQLWEKTGLHLPIVHDELSLIDMDRQIAYFSDPELQVPLLLTTEVGAEGRNFQFCQHLILLDLPSNPDRLEQRIGRLDRIGQQQDVQIHVPCQSLEHSRWLEWYQHLGIFQAPNPHANRLQQQFAQPLAQYIAEGQDGFFAEVQQSQEQLEAEAEQGRDWLLEISSCRQPQAKQLVQAVDKLAEDDGLLLWLSDIAEQLNLFQEGLSADELLLQPVDNMLIPALPGLPEEGLVFTRNRSLALAREDMAILSPDHPCIQALFDLLNGSELGAASVARFHTMALPAGMIFIEAQYSLQLMTSASLAGNSWLAPQYLRLLVDEAVSQDFSQLLPAGKLEPQLRPLSNKVAQKLIRMKKPNLLASLTSLAKLAEQQVAPLQQQGIRALKERLQEQLAQAEWLAEHNPLVTEAELLQQRQQAEQLLATAEQKYQPRLVALRLLVVAPDEED